MESPLHKLMRIRPQTGVVEGILLGNAAKNMVYAITITAAAIVFEFASCDTRARTAHSPHTSRLRPAPAPVQSPAR
jgi:hypothetical protein